MGMLENFAVGAATAFTFTNLLYCLIGVTLGTFIGALPGIGAMAAVSMLLPITFYLDPTTALIMLSGVYYGAEYGGSISSILLNLPGTPSSAVTTLDGNPMARNGQAGVALFTSAVASFWGGSVGIILLMLFAAPLLQVALAFGPADYFAVVLLGLVASSAIGQAAPYKGIAMVALGVTLGCVGTDPHSGAVRFTMGIPELYEGLNLVAVAMGLFGIAEIIGSLRDGDQRGTPAGVRVRDMFPSRTQALRCIGPSLRGAGMGSFFGTLPGTGPTIAAFMAYALEKKISRDPSKFGTGAIEGVAAPEAANNAAVQTAFIPTLIMGIPGTATMALMLGALMIHGISPGTALMIDHPDLFWGVVISFWIGNLLLLCLNIPLIGVWVRILTIPYQYLFPLILTMICLGVYSMNGSIFDVGLALVFGLIGYGLRLVGFEPAPLIMGFVLGPMMEDTLRRALLLARGDYLVVFGRPISGTVMTIVAIMLIWSMVSALRKGFGRRAARPT